MAQKITVREQKQLHYSIRQRRVNGIFTLYSVLLYSAYTIFVFLHYNSNKKQFRLSYGLGLLIAPFTIWFIRRLISWWFNRLTSSNLEYINALRSEQQEKIEDLKQSTNFYSTKALLERFDSSFDKASKRKSVILSGGKPSGSIGGPNVGPKPPGNPSTSGTPGTPGIEQQPLPKPTHKPSNSIAAEDFAFAPNLPSLRSTPKPNELHPDQPDFKPSLISPNHHPELQQYPLGPVYNANYQPSWYDKILDIIVGEDEYSPKSRYALICNNCRRHNGLAQPGELPQYVIYICPQCGFRNGTEKKKRKETQPNLDESLNSKAEKDKRRKSLQSSQKKTHIFTELESNDAEVEEHSTRRSSTAISQESSEFASNEESSVEEVKIIEKPKPTKLGLHQRKKSRKGK